MNKNALPFKLNIAKPCPARWEDMGGGDQVRFCDHCRKNVYNLSAMTSAEATALVEAKHGNLCARFYQRADGTVLTEDCPVGIAQYWRRAKVFAASAIAVFLFALVNIAAFGRGTNDPSTSRPRGKLLTAIEDTKIKIKGLAGLNPPPMRLGKICVKSITGMPMPAPTPTPTLLPLTGRVAVTPRPPANFSSKTNGGLWLTGDVAFSATAPSDPKTNPSPAPDKK
ncbi:MAG: hypothetical protein JWQ04_345 [Pedosphaera sp.]|nr:hypothetical protein [Pedosphaera sp.]